ncbi:MAG TPA: class I SAM-dependent methyltransferase [Bacteroidales bacterium]|nr:class I SAM-dependent methyltransferase [Bacteroidales bacterium]
MKQKAQTEKVSQYYDQWTHHYLSSGYGHIIQAHRPADVTELLEHIAKNAGIRNGMRILDAGCGICGPAVYIAKHFDVNITAITISKVQADIAAEFVAENGLSDRIEVIAGDYHSLDDLFPEASFDLILMLESFGHAVNPAQVLTCANTVLKKGGHIYIKDYFAKEITGNTLRRKNMKRIIANMNKVYAYNLPDINQTIKTLRTLDLELQYIVRNKVPLANDDSVLDFEKKHGIDIFEGGFHYQILEPLELYFKKLIDVDAPIV